MRLIPALALVLAASPALAVDDERTNLLLKLIRDNGCQMSESDAADILPKHNFTRDESRQLAQALVAAGMADIGGEAGIKLTDKGCKG